MGHFVERHDGNGFDGVGNEGTVPEIVGGCGGTKGLVVGLPFMLPETSNVINTRLGFCINLNPHYCAPFQKAQFSVEWTYKHSSNSSEMR